MKLINGGKVDLDSRQIIIILLPYNSCHSFRNAYKYFFNKEKSNLLYKENINKYIRC